jgi:general secretion pathway protein D
VPAVSTNDAPMTPPGDQPPPAPSPNGVPQPPATPDQLTNDTSSASLPTVDTNIIAMVPPGVRGLRMNFKNAPLEAVLRYMSAAAGFIINSKVDLSGKVTVWSEQPMTSDEAVTLLTQILGQNGYTTSLDGRTLTIISTRDAKSSGDTRVGYGEDPDQIAKSSEIITQIIPVKTLNAVQLVKDLQPLLTSDTILNADESANSLVMTSTKTSIHHIVEIVRALDSVQSGNAIICVFPLKFADAKSLATLITTLFPSATATPGQGGGGGFNFGRFRGGGGGGGGFNPFGGGGGESDESKGHTPTAKVAAVSDDHGNLLIVSVPDSLGETISNLVHEVDSPVDDATIMKVFHLKNADPTEMVDLLTSMYPDDTGASDATARQPRFGFPFGGLGGQQANSAGSPSDRAKKLARVTAVADRRTSSLVVTAGKDTMPDIIAMVEDLDSRNDRKVQPYSISLGNADPEAVQAILQQLFPASANGQRPASSSTTSTPATPLEDRSKALLQQQNSTSSSSAFGGSTGSSSGRGF